MTKIECAIVSAYTGVNMLEGEDLRWFYRYVAELFGRPVYTHELPMLSDEIKKRSKKDFLRLCEEATT